MDDNFSPRVKDVITYSKEEALRLGHDFIGTEHLMLGILRDGNGKAINILNNLSIRKMLKMKVSGNFLETFPATKISKKFPETFRKFSSLLLTEGSERDQSNQYKCP